MRRNRMLSRLRGDRQMLAIYQALSNGGPLPQRQSGLPQFCSSLLTVRYAVRLRVTEQWIVRGGSHRRNGHEERNFLPTYNTIHSFSVRADHRASVHCLIQIRRSSRLRSVAIVGNNRCCCPRPPPSSGGKRAGVALHRYDLFLRVAML